MAREKEDILDEEMSDREFEKALMEKYQRQTIAAFRAMEESIKENNMRLLDIMQSTDTRLNIFLKKLEQLARPAEVKPVINVENNNEQIVMELAKLGTEICKSWENLQTALTAPRPVNQWVFDIKRNDAGYISSVIAKPKQ
jgi:hypothetical protein